MRALLGQGYVFYTFKSKRDARIGANPPMVYNNLIEACTANSSTELIRTDLNINTRRVLWSYGVDTFFCLQRMTGREFWQICGMSQKDCDELLEVMELIGYGGWAQKVKRYAENPSLVCKT